jgi:tRNA 2-thiouridine synthesizing protein A
MAEVLDVKGASCPIPIVKTAKAMKALKAGDTLEVLATDPGVEPDMQAWTKQTGNRLISIEKEGEVFRVLLQKV